MNRFASLALTAVAVVAGSPAAAHHSFAAYDMSRTETAPGAIKEFRWGAPHSSAVITVTTPDGKKRDLYVLSGSPIAFSRQGFTPKSIKTGDKVQISWHPNRNGSFGGVAATMKFPDGRVYKEAEGVGGPPGGGAPGAPPPGGPPPGGPPTGGGRPAV